TDSHNVLSFHRHYMFLLPVLLLVVERMNSTRIGHHRLKYRNSSRSGVPVGITSTCRAAAMPLLISCWMVAKVMAGVSDVDVLLGGILSTSDNEVGYQQKTENQAQNDKVSMGMEKYVQNQGQCQKSRK
ncbi:hypothetical protein Tco_1250533, partial [Tanacetum coccineum]